jgi:hypothetical protein
MFVDCFAATSAPPAARRIRILPKNQYACWPITFGMKCSYNSQITAGVENPVL